MIPRLALAAALLIPCVAAARHDAQPFQRGVNYASTWRNHGADGYGSATSQQTLARLHRLGVEWIAVTPFGFMESPSAPEVRTVTARTVEADDRLHDEVAHAHALGIKVSLKPHVWIRNGEWPGA